MKVALVWNPDRRDALWEMRERLLSTRTKTRVSPSLIFSLFMPAKAKTTSNAKTSKRSTSRKTSTTRKKKESKVSKIFVLDTSVILYDHNSIMNFDEHDVAIPITVLEELDEFKKGSDTKNYEARQFIRLLDRKAGEQNINDWISLNGGSKGSFKVIMDTRGQDSDAQNIFGARKNDHKFP